MCVSVSITKSESVRSVLHSLTYIYNSSLSDSVKFDSTGDDSYFIMLRSKTVASPLKKITMMALSIQQWLAFVTLKSNVYDSDNV